MTFTANDQGATGAGGPQSDDETFSVGIDAADLPPLNFAPSVAGASEDTWLYFVGGPKRLAVADPDTSSLTVSLSVDTGALTLGSLDNIVLQTGDGVADAAITIAGNIRDLISALSGVAYTPPPNFNGSVTLTMLTSDGQLTDQSTVAISILADDDAPTLNGPLAIAVLENTPKAIAGAGVIADVDATNLDVTVVASNGTIAATAQGSAVLSATPTQVEITGSIDDVNATAQTLVFTPTTDFVGSGGLAFTINDEAAAVGGPTIVTTTIALDIGAAGTTVAHDDSYATVVNTQLVVDAAHGIFANDSTQTASLSFTSLDDTGTLGTFRLAADGSFTYTPPVGAQGVTDSATYTATDANSVTVQATVSIDIGATVVWYVDASAEADGNCTSASPCSSIADAFAQLQGSGAVVYVAPGTYTGDLSMPGLVSLVGSGAGLQVLPNVTIAPATKPTLQGSVAVITASSVGNNVSGFHIVSGVPASACVLASGSASFAASLLLTQCDTGVSLSSVHDAFIGQSLMQDTTQGLLVASSALADLSMIDVGFSESQTGIVVTATATQTIYADSISTDTMGSESVRVTASGFSTVSIEHTQATLASPTGVHLIGENSGKLTFSLPDVVVTASDTGLLVDAASYVNVGVHTTIFSGALNTAAIAVTAQPNAPSVEVGFTNVTVTSGSGEGLVVNAGSGTAVCLDLADSDFSVASYDVDFEGAGNIALLGYNTAQSVSDYLGGTNTLASTGGTTVKAAATVTNTVECPNVP